MPTTCPSKLRRAALLSGLALLAATPAFAQDAPWPSKPITIVVGYPPGGSTDLNGRAVATELSARLGVPVIVENIGGDLTTARKRRDEMLAAFDAGKPIPYLNAK